MNAAQIKKQLQESPFRPFSVVTADGRQFQVPREDYVGIDPTGWTMIVWARNGAGSVLDVRLIIRLDLPKPKSPAKDRTK